MKLTFPDNSVKEFEEGTTGMQVAESIGERLARDALAIKIDEEVKDLSAPLKEDATVQILTFKDTEGKQVFWHSSAHLLAMAVLDLWPEVKLTIGPPIEHGFYYDFFREHPFNEDDLKKIEEKMKEWRDKKLPFERVQASYEEAKEKIGDNKFKQEILEEYKNEIISFYKNGTFIDLCKGPHVPHTGYLKSFKLLNTSNAYWRGDAKKESLQRIYGISFPDKKELKEYLHMIEEAEKRNHKKIGEEMELFTMFDLIGKGLPVWLPKGEVIRQQIETLAIEKEREYGYVRVNTPHLAKKELFIKSGHLPYYEESMYPKMVMDDGEYYLKAMNCPLHHLIFSKKIRSYRELPMRVAEYGTCYRNELSGTLNGLLRVRSLRMNDAHIYCTKGQIEQEIKATLQMIKEYFELFGLTDFWFRLSLSDLEAKDKYINEPENWKHSEEILKEVLDNLGVKYVEARDEAAFYGPKVDVQFKNVYGREETMSTVQLDFAAKSRFGLSYIDEHNNKNEEVFVIHRAPLSTHERFLAFLIEHYAGKFPLWLAPVQVKILTIADRHLDFAKEVMQKLREKGLRAELDDKALTMGKKIRNAQVEKVPYIGVIGDSEVEHKTLNVRTRDNEVHGEKSVEEFISQVCSEVKERK